MAKIIELIITDDLRGTGKKDDVFRRVIQLYTKSGDLIAEFDPVTREMFFLPDKTLEGHINNIFYKPRKSRKDE